MSRVQLVVRRFHRTFTYEKRYVRLTPTEFERWLGFVITLPVIVPRIPSFWPCLLIPDPYSGKIIKLHSIAQAIVGP
ncbi:MAG: hypothetical protein JWN12_576 [Candidatus Saccharibacteria bacterium]|nr:hypothetical protein [Candidatus Saccharibacteria bacterium]